MSWTESVPSPVARPAPVSSPKAGPGAPGAARQDKVNERALPQPARAVDETVLETLKGIAHERGGNQALAQQLVSLQRLLADDLSVFEAAIASIPRGPARVQRGAVHLLDQGGKRLRPTCVMLAAKLGSGFDERSLDLAVAAELVHNATLLHDDVVDLGDARRGAVAARTLYGNATSIFAGDWLLIQALKRVRRAAVANAFDNLLDVIEQMILAESIQLDARGTLDLSLENWLRVVEGKTAALFRWAMEAGGQAGGLGEADCDALAEFGQHLGVAFQAVDDLLDLSGDPDVLGKDLFADLREGKMTWPLIVGFERDPGLRRRVEESLADGNLSKQLAQDVTVALARTGALVDCQAMAEDRLERALGALDRFPQGAVVDALKAAARVAVERVK